MRAVAIWLGMAVALVSWGCGGAGRTCADAGLADGGLGDGGLCLSEGVGGEGACPQCFDESVNNCLPEGACTFDGIAPGVPGSRICYANGVQVAYGTGVPVTATHSKNGRVCYLSETTIVSQTEVKVVLKRPGGARIGSITFNPQDRFRTATLECAQGTFTVSLEDPSCPGVGSGSNCARGACGP